MSTSSAVSTAKLGIPAGRWIIDPADSRVAFAIKGMWGLIWVKGQFDGFEGTLEVGPDSVSGHLTIDATTLDTGNRKRDEHLRSDDFFGAESHPEITFQTISAAVHEDELMVTGDLVVAGKTTRLELPLEFNGFDRGRIQLSTETTVDREQLGLSWNKLGMIRSETLIDLELELVPAPA
jgi:polyisoprenoid-binding protein YceI